MAVTLRTKEELRKQIQVLLRNQKEEDRLRKSLLILDQLFAVPEFRNSKTMLFYSSFDGEVDTQEMIKQALLMGKTVALPMILKSEKQIIPLVADNLNSLEAGPYGIKQPRYDVNNTLDPRDLDICLVPGVAFDRAHHRLGRGAGYYDRFLAALPNDTPPIGLAFDFQVLERLPVEAHDIPLTRLLYA
jgi:5-formyltetrahydrofolate cyclo-ligase